MRRGRKRQHRQGGQPRRFVRCGAQRRFTGAALAHFQIAFAQFDQRGGVARPQSERTPKEVNRGNMLAIQDHDAGQPDRRVMSLRRLGERLHKKTTRRPTFIASEAEKTKSDTKAVTIRHERKRIFQYRDALVEAAEFAEVLSQLQEGQREYRPPRYSTAQLRQRLVVPPGGIQRHGQQSFSARLAATPRRFLQ